MVYRRPTCATPEGLKGRTMPSTFGPYRGRRYFSKNITLLSLLLVVASTLGYASFNRSGSSPSTSSTQPAPALKQTTITSTQNVKVKSSDKHILFYTGFWDWPDFRIGFGKEPFSQCPVKSCYTTNNRTLLDGGMSDFDAIVMHGAEFRLDRVRKEYIQSWQEDHQRFVFFMMEPPTIHDFSSGYDNFWHYTMTYRRDSDILRPYGFVVPKKDYADQWSIPREDSWAFDYSEKEFVENALPKKSRDFLELAKRPKKIAWVVSNCNARSRREAYVEELQKYIEVDIFGKCGTITCDVEGTRAQSGNCATTVTDEYKFYLSFENTFAKDYVTEKFFLRMNMNLVPIVLGQADYNRTAPPHSFISVLDYESPKALADYIHRLDSNDTEYLTYLWWKEYYHVESQTMMQLAFCDLCAKLHDDDNSRVKPYPNFGKWWHEGANLDEKLPRILGMIGDEEMPSESRVAQQTPRLRMSFEE